MQKLAGPIAMQPPLFQHVLQVLEKEGATKESVLDELDDDWRKGFAHERFVGVHWCMHDVMVRLIRHLDSGTTRSLFFGLSFQKSFKGMWMSCVFWVTNGAISVLHCVLMMFQKWLH